MPFKTPLQEAAAEIDFVKAPLVEFRAATLYQAIRERFPSFQKFSMFLVADDSAAALQPYAPAYRFLSPDNTSLVQYGPRLLSYNRYQYPGWEQFRAEFAGILETAIAAGLPLEMERLALTYVNRMPAKTPEELQALLSIDLEVEPGTLQQDFMNRKVVAHESGLSVTTIAPIGPDQFANEFSLSISCVEIQHLAYAITPERLGEVIGWFEAAHDRISSRFWNLLTPEVQEDWKATHAAIRA
jgi:uncharacterized protein (TIGR04255 family)